MDFLNSQFIKNLENGELPVFKVEIENKTIIGFALALLIVATIVILLNFAFRKRA